MSQRLYWTRFAVLSLALLLGISLASGFTGAGSGTSSDPYQVSNLSELNQTRDNLTAHYELVSDINASDTENWNSGNGWKPVGNLSNSFEGDFYGKGYEIEKLTINRGSEDYVGLFGFTRDTAVIGNISLNSVNITAKGPVGALAGYHRGESISGSSSTGNVSGGVEAGGGLVGTNNGEISRSHSSVEVSGSAEGTNEYNKGGLVGLNYGTILESYSSGKVYGSGSDTGGLVGQDDGTVSNSYWDINTSNQSTSAGGTGLTTSEMKDKSNLNGFDFQDNWEFVFGRNDGYPVLQVFNLTAANIEPVINSVGGPVDGDNTDSSGGVELSANVGDGNGQSMDIWFFDGSDSLIGSVQDKNNGTYSVTWNVNSDQSYSWYVELSDGVDNVTSSTRSFTTHDVTVSWTVNSDNEQGFKIYNNASGSFNRVGTVGKDATLFTDTSSDLSAGTYTCYQVKSYNRFGKSSPLEGCITP